MFVSFGRATFSSPNAKTQNTTKPTSIHAPAHNQPRPNALTSWVLAACCASASSKACVVTACVASASSNTAVNAFRRAARKQRAKRRPTRLVYLVCRLLQHHISLRPRRFWILAHPLISLPIPSPDPSDVRLYLRPDIRARQQLLRKLGVPKALIFKTSVRL